MHPQTFGHNYVAANQFPFLPQEFIVIIDLHEVDNSSCPQAAPSREQLPSKCTNTNEKIKQKEVGRRTVLT